MNELDLKICLLKYLMEFNPEAVIASEVRFCFGERRADLVALTTEVATAYEIKTAKDNTSRLANQCQCYKLFFDFCYIVCEANNLKNIRKNTPREFGLILIDGNSVKILRQSKQFKQQSKTSIASILSKAMLRRLTKAKGELSQIEEIQLALKLPLKTLRKISREYLFEQYSSGFQLMKSEITNVITADDIHTISRKIPRKLHL